MTKFVWAMVLPFVAGCTFGVSGPTEEELAEEPLGSAQSAVTADNAMWPNSLNPNGILPNGILPNSLPPTALDPDEIPSDAMDSLQDPGPAGDLSREFLRYTVGCAFRPDQTFDFVWTDSQNIPHDESYPGQLGLAPEWADGPLSSSKPAWVSSCLAARTNYFGIPVLISMRGTAQGLTTTPEEISTYTHREGAFWGNLLAEEPYVKACYNADEMSYSRLKQRVCATGYDDGTTVHECGILDSIGPCTSFCTLAENPDDGYTQCEGMHQIITTFLD